MRALVTGAAGFIGSRLAQSLLDQDDDVVGVDCFTDYYDPSIKRTRTKKLLAHRRFQMVEADLARADLNPIFKDVDVVFHLAAQAGVRASWGEDFSLYLDRNLHATQRILETMKGGSSRLVFASSSSVYGDAATLPTPETTERSPLSPYGMTKSACEEMLRIYGKAHGLPWVALRYFTVYGPGQRPDMAFQKLITAALKGEEFTVYGDGTQQRDVTFVGDIVTATIAAATAPGAPFEAINIGRGEMVTLGEVLDYVSSFAAKGFRLVYSAFQSGDARATGASIEKARRLLNYAPTVSWRDGIDMQREEIQRG